MMHHTLEKKRKLSFIDIKKIAYFTALSLITAIVYKFIYIIIANLFILKDPIPLNMMFESGYQISLSRYISSILVAPIFETAIFIILIHVVTNKLNDSRLFFILCSSLLFGIYHFPTGGWFLTISTFLGGIIFAWSYHYFRNKLIKDHAAYAVILIHMLFNFVFLHL
ncbi:CPBP family intramembrane glutamic endopeptidase [Pseudocolwellia agarivorans]|uniref:CPBP family intramembrane glutamic endopeptidase n=1 Tax=Pseudocolwellia agarivorans TaxID=1911682 RepID=UPI0009878113|nr:CPBP family intramembrane glutamic endopeptidase [Pseudocolwellia agarivorans]